MAAIEEAKSILTRLTPTERASLYDLLRHDSIEVAPGLFSTASVCGGDTCIRYTRIPVWSLEEGWRLGMSDGQLLEAYPDLTAEDLTRARAYVERHREEIDRLIRENNEA